MHIGIKLFGSVGINRTAHRRIDSPLFADYLQALKRGRKAQPPKNFRARSAKDIKAAADYSVSAGTAGLEVCDAAGVSTRGAILELGPGSDFGPALILGENSEKLTVADRYLAPWDDNFHPAVYREIRRRLGRPSRILDAVIESNSYAGHLATLAEPAYDLTSVASDSVDLVFSNAVLEHVHPLDKAAAEMFRVTRAGGSGVHQVDFRYHRDFDQPLEHLLFTRAEYAELLALTHAEAGCQTRVREAADMFAAAGFEIVRIDVDTIATDDYMQDFLPRLRRSDLSPYRDWPVDELVKIGARLFVRKP